MAKSRQTGDLVSDSNIFVDIANDRVGIGTTNPTSKLYVYDANQNSNTYSSEVYRTSTNFSSGVGQRAYYESYYTTTQTSYASGINAQVSASVAAGSTNNGYIRAGLDAAWRNNANAQSSTDNGTLAYLYGRGIQYGHYDDNAVSPITNNATGLYLSPYCRTGSIGTLIGLDINSVNTAVGATATNVRGINCEIDTTDGTNPYNLYISGNAKNYIAGSVGIGTTNPLGTLQVGAAGTNVFVVTSTGSVGIGTTNPLVSLNVVGQIRASTLAGAGNRAVYSDPTGTLTNSSSDETLKENVLPITYGLDTVCQLNPILFNWIDTERFGPQREIGLIAQQVQSLIPEVVGVNYDETLSLDYSKLTSVLIKSIQELKVENDLLRSEIEAIKQHIGITSINT